MRWWLGLTFALIASVTAFAVAEVFTQRAETAFRDRAQDFTAGRAVTAADAISLSIATGRLKRTVAAEADRHRLALFVFDRHGRLLTPRRSRGIAFGSIPMHAQALKRALAGGRFVATSQHGNTIVVALPLLDQGAAGLVAIASRPDLASDLGIVHDRIVEAAVWAVVVGAIIGLLVATLIARRLRRIASAAAEIERGNFDRRLQPRFRDELGELAATVDRMRERLQASFSSLEAERDGLTRLLERLHEGVVAVNARLDVQFANRAAVRMLGGRSLVPGEALPEPWPDISLKRIASGLFRPAASIAEAHVSLDEEHSYGVVGIPATPGARTAILVFTDISERERRERAEREFVANAAHELRTPLTAISSAVDALNAGAKEEPQERDRFLGLIERQATHLARLVRALLVLARVQTRHESVRLEPIELRPLLEEVAAGVRAADGVSVRVACPVGLAALVQSDLAQHVVSNLADNAAKHTERGRITLAARPETDGFVVIEVADTGSGISPDVQERVFDRFFSSESGDRAGFGLGLAIVRESVRALGGTIEVESKSGAGTTVTVTLAGVEVGTV
jgi:signal transduction histidine kinase/HAMP domain-containing protein